MKRLSNFFKQTFKRVSLFSFIQDHRSIGIILLFSAILSIVLTNLPVIGLFYEGFWLHSIPFLSKLNFPNSPLEIINSLFMVLFFFSVGMEIKYEIVDGSLSSPKRILSPMISAIFGVLFPAFIFLLISKGTVYSNGWAIPTATDIAFSLGALSLLGNAIPRSAKVFLMSLAIIDDLSAVLIIAFFYGSSPAFVWLGAVLVTVIAVLLSIKYLSKNIRKIAFIVLGLAMWYFMFRSGIHATLVGVIMAALLPIEVIKRYKDKFYIPVNFVVMPLFALANTSIAINFASISSIFSKLSLATIFGLFIGKPLGIVSAIFLLMKMKIMSFSSKKKFKIFVGVAIFAGIGFTMSIFLSMLTFDNKEMQDIAKLAVLLASIMSMIVGYIWLRLVTKKTNRNFVYKLKKMRSLVFWK